MISSAEIIGDYRYCLIRWWNDQRPLLVVCMLNPSTADADKNDPTITTLIHFARLWGWGGIWIVNENAYRSSSPEEMALQDDARGTLNAIYIRKAVEYASRNGNVALAAWGNGTDGRRFRREADAQGVKLICLGTTQSGAPKHPLARGLHRIPRNQQPMNWTGQ